MTAAAEERLWSDGRNGRNVAMSLATIERIALEAAEDAADCCEEYSYYPIALLDEIRYHFEQSGCADMTQLEILVLNEECGIDQPEPLAALLAYDRRKYTRRSDDLVRSRESAERLREALEAAGNGEPIRDRLDRSIAKHGQKAGATGDRRALGGETL